jgi:hypothetical protein
VNVCVCVFRSPMSFRERLRLRFRFPIRFRSRSRRFRRTENANANVHGRVGKRKRSRKGHRKTQTQTFTGGSRGVRNMQTFTGREGHGDPYPRDCKPPGHNPARGCIKKTLASTAFFTFCWTSFCFFYFFNHHILLRLNVIILRLCLGAFHLAFILHILVVTSITCPGSNFAMTYNS